MATYNLTGSGYWGNNSLLSGVTWGTLAWNDIINLNGYNLTVDPAQQTPTGFDTGVGIINTAGFAIFRMVNTSTSTPLIYYGPTAGALRIENGCSWKVEGDYIQIGTGDGTESQAISGYTSAGFNAADEPAFVEVETGSGTNTFEQYVTLGDLAFSDIGVGELGKWFSYNTSTGVLTFGNGGKPNAVTSNAASGQKVVNVSVGGDFATSQWVHIIEGNTRETIQIDTITGNALTMKTNLVNSYTTSAIVRGVTGGNIITNGAKIRVPNIYTGSKNGSGVRTISATPGDDYELDANNGGLIDINKMNVGGFYLNFDHAGSLNVQYVGSIHKLYLAFNKGALIDHTCVGVKRVGTGAGPGIHLYYAVYNSTISNCKAAAKTGYGFYMQNSDDSNQLTNTECWIVKKTSTSDYSIRCDDANMPATGCSFIGGQAFFNGSQEKTILNCRVSESPNGAPLSANHISTVRCVNCVIDNAIAIPDGYQTIISNNGTFLNQYKIQNTTFPCLSQSAVVLNVAKPMLIKNCNFGSVPNLAASAETNKGNTIQNVSGNFLNALIGRGMGLLIKGLACSSKDATWTGLGIDSIFYEAHISTSDGFMGLYFNQQTPGNSYYAVSNDSHIKFNGGGRLYIVSAGGWIEYTWPHVIKGLTAFPVGGAQRINGSGTGNFTLQYKIDLLEGNGYSDWRTLAGANLDDHTIDPAKGFRFKVKISHSAGSTSDYLDRLNWDATVDYATYKYSLDLVSISLQNVKDGSAYWIYNNTTSQVIASGTQSGTGNITIPNVPYNGSDELLTIRVRKSSGSPYYKPFETNAMLTSAGAAVWVAQESDILIPA